MPQVVEPGTIRQAQDPDAATSHGETLHADPVEVLRSVIATSGEDTSAAQIRRAEQAAPWAPWRHEAQGFATRIAEREVLEM